jgi:hypothetical protein
VRRPAPPAAKIQAMMGAIRELMPLAGEEHVEKEATLMSTWSAASRARFAVRVETGDTRIKILVERKQDPAPGAATAGIHFLLDRGTRLKYIAWSEDFEAKTEPGKITSGPGAGSVWFDPQPKPGIEARNFVENINKTIDTGDYVAEALKAAFGAAQRL